MIRDPTFQRRVPTALPVPLPVALPGALPVVLSVLAILVSVLVSACTKEAPSDDFPPGTWGFGSVSALRPLLEDSSRLEGTPVARLAMGWLDQLDGCEQFSWRASASPNTGGEIECDGAIPESVAADLATSGAVWVVSGLLGDGNRWFWRGDAMVGDRTSQRSVLELPSEMAQGPADLLLPEADGGASALLSTEAALIHLRMSMDRALDPAAWLPSGGAADELFGLRGRLFSQAVLDGRWELVVLSPEADGRLPLALALGIRSRAAAETAVASLVSELSRIWGLVPRELRLGDGPVGDRRIDDDDGEDRETRQASCFTELRLLPGLEPCWRVEQEALVVAWNAAALEAVIGQGVLGPDIAPARLKVDLERFPEAEALLERRLWSELAMPDKSENDRAGMIGDGIDGEVAGGVGDDRRNPYPWRQWLIEGRRVENRYRFEINLERTPAEAPAE